MSTTPKLKMTTPIPEEITTPDSVETRLGTLKFFDGFPDEATIQKVYDNLDFQRGVQAFLTCVPGASEAAIRAGIRSFGPENQTVVLFDSLMDSKSLFLTANTESVYAWSWLNLKDGPMVMETPPNVLGVVDDFWFRNVTDFGLVGPDKGKGGKYLMLPPGYTGEVPEGYVDIYMGPKAPKGFEKNWIPTVAGRGWFTLFRLYAPTEAYFDKSWPLPSIEQVK